MVPVGIVGRPLGSGGQSFNELATGGASLASGCKHKVVVAPADPPPDELRASAAVSGAPPEYDSEAASVLLAGAVGCGGIGSGGERSQLIMALKHTAPSPAHTAK